MREYILSCRFKRLRDSFFAQHARVYERALHCRCSVLVFVQRGTVCSDADEHHRRAINYGPTGTSSNESTRQRMELTALKTHGFMSHSHQSSDCEMQRDQLICQSRSSSAKPGTPVTVYLAVEGEGEAC